VETAVLSKQADEGALARLQMRDWIDAKEERRRFQVELIRRWFILTNR